MTSPSNEPLHWTEPDPVAPSGHRRNRSPEQVQRNLIVALVAVSVVAVVAIISLIGVATSKNNQPSAGSGSGAAVQAAEVATTAPDMLYQTTPMTTKTSPTKSPAPAGFKSAGGGMWVKWASKGTFSCGYYDSCWGLDVFSEYGCPSGLYVEISISTGGVATDWTNGTLSGLSPGERGQLVMGTVGRGSGNRSAKITEVNCR
ncbi:hypothetical protein GIS00_02880 [Nakamurella sp. YIM 132087]|uniref:Uncharacterized protein n=1 Tax=Nakamurella alba TaxID=2665158 RepID=A0A7K1FFP6_9ACTN|nr:hypothetical protein [Nakamurella alba]MTD12890.1 hypothetical protein [Nakamurella alba]